MHPKPDRGGVDAFIIPHTLLLRHVIARPLHVCAQEGWGEAISLFNIQGEIASRLGPGRAVGKAPPRNDVIRVRLSSYPHTRKSVLPTSFNRPRFILVLVLIDFLKMVTGMRKRAAIHPAAVSFENWSSEDGIKGHIV